MIKENNNNIFEKDYFNDLQKIKETIKTNQAKAMIVVNSTMIMTYYEIGTIINKRKTWGSKYIQNLANDLKEYGKGYSTQNLYRMAQIANEYTHNELFSQAGIEIPWRTLIEIMSKSKSHAEMLWYIYKNQAKVIIKFINTYIDTFLNILSSFLIYSLFYYKPKKYY